MGKRRTVSKAEQPPEPVEAPEWTAPVPGTLNPSGYDIGRPPEPDRDVWADRAQQREFLAQRAREQGGESVAGEG